MRVGMREIPIALEPASLATSSSSNLSRLIFESLVLIDAQGRLQPQLATSWQAEGGKQRWRFVLRRGVFFHDGTPLDAASVVAALRSGHPEWRVQSEGTTVLIETEAPDAELPRELALPRNAVYRVGDEHPTGTGPFAIAEWVRGKRLRLTANSRYWFGRPFLDGIEIQFGLSDKDQMIAIDLARLDIAEIASENIRRATRENRIIHDSQPEELMALVFSKAPHSDEEAHVRNALRLALDTRAMNEVLLQGEGDSSSALLPNWLSGYAFLFRAPQDEGPRALAAPGKNPAPTLGLAYDSSDSLARLVAERILLNARDVGIVVELGNANSSDLTLRRIPLASPDPKLALIELARALALPRPQFADDSLGALYASEKALLESLRVIPLLHLRSAMAVGRSVRGEGMLVDGSWQLVDAWLIPEKP
ncbi:MAG: hypothetical protein JO356_20235 [Acidobacteria bacterium]|nr:hypothetical protein [Acidobacteriota bacterium]